MNFIPAAVKSSAGQEMDLEFYGIHARYVSEEPLSGDAKEVILGIRPEHIAILDEGKIAATAYATLPTGMETTVRVMLDGELLSAVVFGSIDYPVDHPIKIDFTGNDIVLFDKASSNRIGIGKLIIQ